MEKVITINGKETQEFAQQFAKNLKQGDILCLYGNLGAGKTTFVQGLAKGLGIKKRIISPTFVIIRSYHGDKDFFHADLYRLGHENEIESTGLLDILVQKNTIVAIEWPEKMGTLLPKVRWDITFSQLGDTKREIFIEKHE